MKIAAIIIRTMLGLLFLYTSISYFFHLTPEPVSTGEFKAFQLGLVASMYLFPLAKAVELLCGLSFITGKYMTLANIIIFPVTLNILLINYFLTPENLPIAIFVFVGNIFLIFTHWENYKGLFKAD
ncbi:MAG: DoxX family membrane protein [Flavobacteriaceae bacterium]|jgi:putative oxidoreductase|uniref:DoxX family membrane protein n=1 Tax=Flavobacterium kayseriense TaxID=2764714 RepID=A0ABR7JAM9_9FLAO|nr:DoxX family membrane protein [Flavobacterium kayseriense]MBC5842579.1 DoxX family membrane protein [Flavobacterium kayseriense]MBC5849109.1 DoxX family membrane protein [Flavobacterium kayseriense]MBU0942406.1 DoxX family membrane protein [Bacteroidota bacterium]MBX9886740.1 DoxX family membrane protein [Flavobacteriaceae bacterium]